LGLKLWRADGTETSGQRGNAWDYAGSLIFRLGWNLAATELNLSSVIGFVLASVLSVERSETNVAITMITNMPMAVSQIEPARISSGGRV